MYLTELVHINNSINYFMINIKEEQIQSLIDKLEKLEIIGEKIENEIDIKLKNTALERKKNSR